MIQRRKSVLVLSLVSGNSFNSLLQWSIRISSDLFIFLFRMMDFNIQNDLYGFDLPENRASKFIFKAAMSRIWDSLFPKSSDSSLSRARLEFKDIEQVRAIVLAACWALLNMLSSNFFLLSGWSASRRNRTFWVGMPFITQVHILEICTCSDSVRTLVVFRDGKWLKTDQILKYLQGQRSVILS